LHLLPCQLVPAAVYLRNGHRKPLEPFHHGTAPLLVSKKLKTQLLQYSLGMLNCQLCCHLRRRGRHAEKGPKRGGTAPWSLGFCTVQCYNEKKHCGTLS